MVLLTGILLLAFNGVTDRLIPLFAVGALLAFTFSQTGMVAHWKRTGGKKLAHKHVDQRSGGSLNRDALLIVLVSKFLEGAWFILILILGILLVMKAVRRYYDQVEEQLSFDDTLAKEDVRPPLVIVPVEGWNRISHKALRFALSLSTDVIALHVEHSEMESDILAGVHLLSFGRGRQTGS